LSEQLGLFVNLDSLREDEPAYAAEWDADIVDEAQALLDRGGLAITE